MTYNGPQFPTVSDGPRWQDAIGYVRRREGVGFAEAC